MTLRLDDVLVAVPCPRCQYESEVTILQVRLEERILCPCCKAWIRLQDESASVHGAEQALQAALNRLTRQLGFGQ